MNPHSSAWLQALPHPAWLVELPAQRVAVLNDPAAAMLAGEAPRWVGRPARELLASPEDLAWWDGAAAGHRDVLDSIALLALPDGRTLRARRRIAWVGPLDGPAGSALVSVVPEAEASAGPSGMPTAEDSAQLELSELRATLESSPEGLLVTDSLGHPRRFNRRFVQLWNLPVSLLQAREPRAIAAWMQGAVADSAAYAERLDALRNAPMARARDEIRLLGGTVLERVSEPLLREGHVLGRVWSYREAGVQAAAEPAPAAGGSGLDALTLLPDRRRMGALVEASLRAGSGAMQALLVVDLDRFRRINDSLGHMTGDRVLQEVAARLANCLRQGDCLGRLGNDQFAIWLQGTDAAAAEAAARRMLNAVAQPCCIDNHTFTLTCSIGIALAPAHGSDAGELLAHAESALGDAKRGGRGDVRVHQARNRPDRRAHMKLDHAMRGALLGGGFRLHYQPQLDLSSGQIVGAEALLRWRDAELGEVPPGRFIPVAEDSGFIVAIGDWVLAQAVRQAALWHDKGHEVPVAVNVSALQFNQASFVERVASVLAVSGLPPHLLELELTESILVREADEALARLRALARLGVQLSIDDFGTGYSSLAYLKRFPVGKLKIDRSFVQGLPRDETDAGIVRAILQMARALEKTVIAEGVETEAQREFLLREGCAQMQGFLYAGALDVPAFEERLADGAGKPRLRLVHG